MLYWKGNSLGITNAGEKPEGGKGMLNINAIEVKIDPPAEWKDILDEAWRVNRDYFYDPGMHGVDWAAMKTKYEAFLPDLSCRSDLNRVLQWMLSELSIGHSYITNQGDFLYQPKDIKGGLLGADYNIENNRYRIKKIYGGLNWNPRLRSPLTEPGVNVNVGEYILAVNGKDVKATDEFYQYFENTAGKITEPTVGPNPDGTNSRVVKVVPVENEYDLRNRDWVEGNLKKVTEATNGQVAYVYVPNTATLGYNYFKRYFYPQANRKAIIVDERFKVRSLFVSDLQHSRCAWTLQIGTGQKRCGGCANRRQRSLELVRHGIDQSRSQAVTLVVEHPPAALRPVHADKDRLKQVLINLVGNALKFTNQGSVKVNFSDAGEFLKITVSDTGCGMTEEAKKMLFHKFEQTGTNPLTRDSVRGTGLGLYISKLLMIDMSGDIYLESSELDHGTVFAVTIPYARAV